MKWWASRRSGHELGYSGPMCVEIAFKVWSRATIIQNQALGDVVPELGQPFLLTGCLHRK